MNLKSMNCVLVSISMFFVLFGVNGYTDSRLVSSIVIKDPKPNLEEKKYARLKYVNELVESEDDEIFLAIPADVVADKNGNIYVSDKKQAKLLKYNKDLKVVAQYGTVGQGPEDFYKNTFYAFSNIGIGYDNMLYIGDRFNKTLHILSPELKLKKIIKVKAPGVIAFFFSVPPDKDGNIYLTNCTADDSGRVLQVDKNGELKRDFFDEKKLTYQLFFEAHRPFRQRPLGVVPGMLPLFVVKKNLLLLYTKGSGFAYIYKNGKLLRKLTLWPRKALKEFESRIKEEYSKYKRTNFAFFSYLFVDRDDENYFYLHFHFRDERDKVYLYKFDLDGNLVKILYAKKPEKGLLLFRYKRNNLFYAIGMNNPRERTIKIFKEVVKWN